MRNESISIIRANSAELDFGVNGSGINIAIIDTGIFNHTEFQTPNRIVKQKCYCTGCCPGGLDESDNATDDHGHGTHVAGIVAGKGDGYGRGVATNASLFAVKVLNAWGLGWESDIIKGIEWAVNNGAHIILMSLGAPYYRDCYDSFLSTAVDDVTEQGVIVVVAAGNSGPTSRTIELPACAKEVIAVGSTKDGSEDAVPVDEISSFSSRGPTRDNRTKPDLVAPGERINSVILDNKYISESGTSMAAPHVAGVAALVIQKFHNIQVILKI